MKANCQYGFSWGKVIAIIPIASGELSTNEFDPDA
jgi:hypothetical protein